MYILSRLLTQTRTLKLLIVLPVIFLLAGVTAQAAQSEFPRTDPYDSANVVVNGQVIFQIIGIAAFPASKRANTIERKVEALAQDPAFDPANLSIKTESDRLIIMASGQPIMTIVGQDAEVQGVDIQVLAELYRDKIKQVIADYRHDRQPDIIEKNIVYASIATTILVAIIFGVNFMYRRVLHFVEQRYRRHVEKLETKSLRMLQAKQVWMVVIGAANLSKAILLLVLFYIYLNSVMSLFPWTRYIAQRLIDYTIDPLVIMVNALVAYLPSLFFLIILIIVVRYLLKLSRMFFNAIATQQIHFRNFDAEWSWPTYRIIRTLVIVFSVVIAYPYIPGSDSEAFKGISLFIGVLISLGSTSMLSNVLAGYTMIYRRAFRVGDLVKIGNTLGYVMEMRLLVTHIRSLKNEDVIIPNSQILNNEVINYSSLAKQHGLILHTCVGIGYEVPWRQVEAMLLLAAERTQGLDESKTPFIVQKSLGDFAVTYELNVYVNNTDNMMRLYSVLHRNILDVFNEYEVQIMTPAYIADTPEPKITPKAKWFSPPAKVPGAETS